MIEKHLSDGEADAALAKASCWEEENREQIASLSQRINERAKDRAELRVLSDFPNALKAVSDLMDWGEAKHPGEEWKALPNWHHLNREDTHTRSWRYEEKVNPESGRSHLVHAACRLLMAIEAEAREKL